MPPNENRFKVVALIASGLACAACSSALAQDLGQPARSVQSEDQPPAVVYPIGLQSNRSLYASMLGPIASQSPVVPGKPRKSVIGDIPANSEALTWKLGSWVVRPTASYEPLAAATWSAVGAPPLPGNVTR